VTLSSQRSRLFAILLLSAFATLALAQNSDVSSDAGSGSDQTQSLGDLARKARKDHTQEVRISDAEAQELFRSVDKIIDFASEDTGFPKHSTVKRRLISSADVEKYTREQEEKQNWTQRFGGAELTMKKFGLLPRDFNLDEFLVKSNGKQIAAYYDFETKTVCMLNWIPPEQQKPILAHELTHALQDQNYDLQKFLKLAPAAAEQESEAERDEDSPMARRAVTEGQAQVVYLDYALAPYGRSVQNTPALIYQMEEPAVKAARDSELLHRAPMIMREVGTFPYRAGLIFEGELLQKGGKEMAFAGAFTRPPRSTHEVLQPRAYIEREKISGVVIPDLQQVLGSSYAVYDSGGIGELDVRAMLEQYGERRAAETLSASWQGGRYVAYRKTANTSKETSTADLALLYVSRWKSASVAQRFAQIYTAALAQRYQNVVPQAIPACSGVKCPVAAAVVSTQEGPVVIEQWADNTVVVSESFDQMTADKLMNAVRDGNPETQAENSPSDELGSRLYEVPGFSAFQAQIGQEILREAFARVIPQ